MLKSPYLRKIYLSKKLDKSDGYANSIPMLSGDFTIDLTSPISVFTGENGTGKSTILESIAINCGFGVLGGNRNFQKEGDVDIEKLAQKLRFSWSKKITRGFFLRGESFFNFASTIDQMAEESGAEVAYRPYGGRSLHAQSHGEAFLSLAQARFHSAGVYLLDEPESALSPMRQLAFASILMSAVKDGSSQIIMVTHSPILMCIPGAVVYRFDGENVEIINPEDTDHFKMYKSFLQNPGRYFNHLE